jgi:RNA polymerase sigma-70 factor (ECF subfamily)
MDLRPDNSLILQTALSMSRTSDDLAGSPADSEVARLVQLTLSGESRAFDQLIVRYQTRVMNMAMRLLGVRADAQDAAQEVFIRAFKYLHRLDLQKPIEPWLMRITINVCRRLERKRRYQRNTLVEIDAPDTIDESGDPYTGLAEKQNIRMLHIALKSLPQKERMAIMLRDVEGLSTAEVAEILGSSETTVRSQVSRGRLRMKETMDRLMGGQQ